jgi:glyoxylase-like metal-dependent hydrolase (beta-lactamase superfamily II)
MYAAGPVATAQEPSAPPAGTPPRVTVVTTPLTPDVSLLTVPAPGVPAGSAPAASSANVVVVNGPDGAFMIDAGPPEGSTELLGAVNRIAPAPSVRGLFNTHWHLDHTGCNDQIGRTGTRIIAHTNTKLWMDTEIVQEWQQRTYKPRAAAALPTETFYKSGTVSFGRERMDYGHLPMAHTDGDIYVFLRTANVLVAGDVVSQSYPILDYSTGGWIGGLTDATKALLDLANADTRIVPGSGPVLTRADLQAQHAMLTEVRARLVVLLKKGMSARDMIAAGPTKEFDQKWGNPNLFIANAYKGLWGHVRELGGIV